jgi:predicted methyltransferase
VLAPILAQARNLINCALTPGDTAVDATVGNGHDTLFLAECVGPTGRVVGFDIQPAALTETTRRLREAGLEERVELLLRGHEEMTAWFAESALLPHPQAVMFNLGYRPGGDKSVITHPVTTVTALGSALDLLVPGGVITVVLYPGHEGGRAETEAVLSWARTVPANLALVACHQVLNTRKAGPLLLAIAKGS